MSAEKITKSVHSVLKNLTYYDAKVEQDSSSLSDDLKLNQHAIRSLAVPLSKIVKKYKPNLFIKMSECLKFKTVGDVVMLTTTRSGF